MANVSILGGNVTIYFPGDLSGDKQLNWTGSTSTSVTHTVNELYSAIQDVFDNDTAGVGNYVNVGVPMLAVSPSVYRIGVIESNDPEPWFITQELTEHLTGGSIKTVGWDRVVGTKTGIVRVLADTNNETFITTADIGDTITHPDGDSGTLLDVQPDYAGNKSFLYIRPDSSASTDNFDGTTGNVTCSTSGNTAPVEASWTHAWFGARSQGHTGNELWANIKHLGDVGSQAISRLYQYAHRPTGNTVKIAFKQSWWPQGTFDRLFKMTDATADDADPFIDDGWMTFKFVPSSGATTFEKPDFSTFQVTGEGTFNAILNNLPDTALTNQSEASGGIVIEVAGPYSVDVDPDIGSPNENYSIKIDVNNRPFANVYNYFHALTQSNNSVFVGTALNGVSNQEFKGTDHQIDYATESGTVSIGDRVYDETSDARGWVVTKTAGNVILCNSFGTFTAGGNLVGPSGNLTSISNIESFAPKVSAPFGLLAGDRMFGTRGVYFANELASESNSYETIDNEGNQIAEEIQVTYNVTNIIANTEIRLFTTDLSTELGGHNDIGGPSDPNQDANVTYSGPDADGRYTASYQYVYSSDTDIIVIAINTLYQAVRRDDTLTNADKSLRIAQIFDRQYIP